MISEAPATPYHVEDFSGDERARLTRYVSNLDQPVFALTGLPQVTAAALFARYSRSAKSLRRLLLDEFLGADGEVSDTSGSAGADRAGELFARVVSEFGDDSVAQLGGLHIACEQVSQPLAKAIEWGRLAAYLEQSTRYIPYTDRRDGWYRWHRDPEVMGSRHRDTYVVAMDGLFDAYSALIDPLRAHLDGVLPMQDDVKARSRAIRALALDILRGLLPAGTVSNVGVFASPQAYEQMVLRLRAHPLPEARAYAELVAAELRATVPDFVARMDRPDRGGVWAGYLAEVRTAEATAAATLGLTEAAADASVRLVDWDKDGENKIIAAALYPHAAGSFEDVLAAVTNLPVERRAAVFAEVVGNRRNRRHKPGRGFEHADYTFEIVSDYGAFRDLQRHRMLTIQWQPLTPLLGYSIPAEITAAGLDASWREAVERATAAHTAIAPDFPEQAQYLVTLAHRVRYAIKLNAREAMHMIELRTSPQGHPAYRRVCREMHRLIDEVAEHHLVAGAMRFVGSEDVHLPRYASEASRDAG